ncbi:MBL fold metallo-hydrolase [Thermostichus vulcanus]|uniref:MBL fold metallo-hydrolase n=1 Tax=Thermostichus vulcanus str. 'Rupite' TaxID=2813851 RepID=A0ABT0CAR6_THEVL|nr:MBL fold metallo-hydrolase [Thermostichus vulcanus]MCJ2542846.1 MBL fold metallo-hydrolase [Thermostichus vulcanus str. 'Rupite']
MHDILTFARGSQFLAVNGNDQICYAVQPLIQALLQDFVDTHDLGLSIQRGLQVQPEVAEALFDIDLDSPEPFSLKPQFLFPETNPLLGLFFSNTRIPSFLRREGREAIQDEAILPAIHQLLAQCGRGTQTRQQILEQLPEEVHPLLEKLIASQVLVEQPYTPVAAPLGSSGVYRLQHAALLYRSGTTGILVDPQFHSNYGREGLKADITRAMVEGQVDAILISHSHYDHWHYPTLMMFPADIPVIVPKVPRPSLMCEDMEGRLRSLGFEQVIAVDWYADPIRIGDIDVRVLPFYGEQPLVPRFDSPQHPDLRNWGNTYLLQCEEFTSWFLIDAGFEPAASMVEVAEYVRDRFAPLDHLISNFQALSYNSIGTDLSSWGVDIVANLLSNPRIFSVTNEQEGGYIATLGPAGVAELSSITQAKACLPYADSWSDLGTPGIHDRELIEATLVELQKRGAATAVIPWHIGDGYVYSKTGSPHQLLRNAIRSGR